MLTGLLPFLVLAAVLYFARPNVEANIRKSISEYVAKLQLDDRKLYGTDAYIKHEVKDIKIDRNGNSAVVQCVLTKGKSKDDTPAETEVTLQLLKTDGKWAVM